MDLRRLQEEANKLLLLYHNAVGTIEREASGAGVSDVMKTLSQEIKRCRETILRLLEEEESEATVTADHAEVLRDGAMVVEDARYFIDKLVGGVDEK